MPRSRDQGRAREAGRGPEPLVAGPALCPDQPRDPRIASNCLGPKGQLWAEDGTPSCASRGGGEWEEVARTEGTRGQRLRGGSWQGRQGGPRIRMAKADFGYSRKPFTARKGGLIYF